MRPARVLVIFLLVCLGTAQETTTYIGHYLKPFPGPQVYKDTNSGMLFYVETADGMWLQSQAKENCCGVKTPSKTRICRFTGRKSRKLFTSVQPRRAFTHPERSQTSSSQSRSIRPSLDCCG